MCGPQGDHKSLTGSLATTLKDIHDAGGQAIAVQVDIGDYDSCATCVEEVQRELGPIDILVNNAAYTFFNPIIGPLTIHPAHQWLIESTPCARRLSPRSVTDSVRLLPCWTSDYPVSRWHASSAVNFNGMFYMSQ